MKKCENCFEQNADGATHCVVCGEALPVSQVEFVGTGVVSTVTPMGFSLQGVTVMKQPEETVDPVAAEKIIEQAQADPKKFLEETGPMHLAELCAKAQVTIGVVTASPPEYIGKFPTEPLPLGKAAIEVYHDSEPRVLYTHFIVNDITLIGREDPQRDVFPDIDLAKLEGVSAMHASREHLRILHQGNQFFLYIYPGSTGTQVNQDIIPETLYGKKFEIQIGDRIILGGKVRIKLVQR